ncbi:uncharacterized protein LOC110813727 [Carica papaya]|uniref:uncharacterized protein LOC110813727 n=1 Tax=Carica papaya TaxID=3649 RepID=UPI000B8CF04C|nr:uncharacterized protein LOC110813727 [Carica papaya]XP_021896663.1 uncharacterized protein LOC110813727 [Carica papaya]
MEKSMLMNQDEEEKHLECNICFQSPREAVVSLCGHLFCWPCLYTWLHFYSPSQTHHCPVCKSPIHLHELIPLYATPPVSISASGIHIPGRPRPEISHPPPPYPSQSGARRQLVFWVRQVSHWIDNLIIILLYGVLLPGLVVLCFKVWTHEIRNANGFGDEKSELGHSRMLYKHEDIYYYNHHEIGEGLLQSSSSPLQHWLFLFVVCMLLAIEFRVAGY